MRECMVIILVFASVLVVGCSVNQEFVKAVDGYTKVILPEYKDYITNDPDLSEDTMRIRIQTADKFQELVDEAKEE
jgi:hypothetical protein